MTEAVMAVLVAGVASGVLGTLAMDSLNLVFARAGWVTRIDAAMIGRMARGWSRGRFRYGHPSEIEEVRHALLLGYVVHYGIGLALAVPYVAAFGLLGRPAPAAWAPLYGLATTAASWFLVFPSMGLGAFGRRAPEGARAALSSLANHLFYGLGIAAALALL